MAERAQERIDPKTLAVKKIIAVESRNVAF